MQYKEISRGIDYLTLRVPESILFTRAKELVEVGMEYKIIGYPFKMKYTEDCPNGKKFRIIRLMDTSGNRLGQIKIVKEKGLQNIYNELELQGAYFMGYGRTNLKDFIADWGLDIYENRGVARMDFRFDVLASSQSIWNKHFYKQPIPLQKRQENKIATWYRSKTDRIEFCGYDKKLDIMETPEKMNFYDVDGNRVYDEYIKCEHDITRIEYRKNSKALRETKRTIIEELAYIELDAIEYAKKFDIEFTYTGYTRKYGKSDNQKLRETKEREKIVHAVQMIEAYVKTLDMFGKSSELVNLLYDRYGLEVTRRIQDRHMQKVIEAEAIFNNDIGKQLTDYDIFSSSLRSKVLGG